MSREAGTLSADAKDALLTEYKTLRDETLKRVELRNNLWNFTLVSAGTILTIGTAADAARLALLVYPVLVFFFAAAFSYNTMMLINIGAYIREVVEENIAGLGWAHYLVGGYDRIERLEHAAKYGLFVGAPILVVAFASLSYGDKFGLIEWVCLGAGVIAILCTIGVVHLPEAHHRDVLARTPARPT